MLEGPIDAEEVVRLVARDLAPLRSQRLAIITHLHNLRHYVRI
jgi:hypothetical protein